ncbi:MAG: hypothetical protein FWC27_14960 [Firmicutes bacterium]|nr:hypothetical protein [Bacillota bacterium]
MRNVILKYPKIRDLREDRDIPLDVMGQLADFYGTSADYLMGRTGEPAPYERG